MEHRNWHSSFTAVGRLVKRISLYLISRPYYPPFSNHFFYFFVKQWIYLPTDFLINIPLKITRTYFALFQFKVDAEVLLTNNTQEPPSPALSSSINGVIY